MNILVKLIIYLLVQLVNIMLIIDLGIKNKDNNIVKNQFISIINNIKERILQTINL